MRARPDRRKQLIRLIHVAKRDLALDDGDYRAKLEMIAGKPSTTEMTIPELETVLERMKRDGFRIRRKGSSRVVADHPQTRKLRATWLELFEAGIVRDSSESALISWVKSQSSIEDLNWLDAKIASQLIERLKKWQKRKASVTP